MCAAQINSTQPRLLIVDDQPDHLRLLSAMLIDKGYEVRRALSGTLDLRNIQVHPPDLILLDINMPKISGYEVCRTLKADAKTRSIPIIFLSASNREQDKVQAFEVGGVDYITKPFQVREVLARVTTQLKLQQLNRLREHLSRMLVHDLRSPLSSISLCSSALLRRAYIEPDDQAILKTIYSTSQRLNHMLNDLMITAKLDAGQLALNRQPVEIQGLIHEVLQGLTLEADAKQVKLIGPSAQAPYEMSLDINLFRRVIENLITNAIKFSPVGGTITVMVETPGGATSAGETSTGETGDRSGVRLKVSDEGMGVPEHQRQAVFEPYETGQCVDGVSQIGLGLSFCQLVVDAHGGHIDVMDNEPTGAIFVVMLPVP